MQCCTEMSESSCRVNEQPALRLYAADCYLLVFSEGNCTQQSKGFDYCPVHATGASTGFYESGLYLTLLIIQPDLLLHNSFFSLSTKLGTHPSEHPAESRETPFDRLPGHHRSNSDPHLWVIESIHLVCKSLECARKMRGNSTGMLQQNSKVL